MTPERAEALALWRYALISEAVSPRLSPAERGLAMRQIAARPQEDVQGRPCRVSRTSLDRWLRAYRAQGLDGLRPQPRHDSGSVRRHPELYAEAAALRREHPARSAGAIADILAARHGVRLPARTVREQLQRQGLQRAALEHEPHSFGRYEAARRNERWIGDVLVGPFVPHPRVQGSRRAKLFLLVDDHSRLLVYGRWVAEENTRAGQHVLRFAINRRGVPEQLYVDNGSPYIAAPLARSCAVLGIRLIHSKPYSPQGRGKQERLNRVIRERFLLEAEASGIASFDQLNDRFQAWVEEYLNCRIHSETHETPIARFLAGGAPPAVDQPMLAEAFRWSVLRVVSKVALVSVEGNRYQVDASLVGRRVELRFDPEDMTKLDVYDGTRPAGVAVPFVLAHHTHPAVPQAQREPAPATGVDYLGMVHAHHQEVTGGPIAYRNVTGGNDNDNDNDNDNEETP